MISPGTTTTLGTTPVGASLRIVPQARFVHSARYDMEEVYSSGVPLPRSKEVHKSTTRETERKDSREKTARQACGTRRCSDQYLFRSADISRVLCSTALPVCGAARLAPARARTARSAEPSARRPTDRMRSPGPARPTALSTSRTTGCAGDNPVTYSCNLCGG